MLRFRANGPLKSGVRPAAVLAHDARGVHITLHVDHELAIADAGMLAVAVQATQAVRADDACDPR